MSGHSKWHSIRHKKGAVDAKRGKLFTKLIREVLVSARTGGGDENANPRLRTAILKAKLANMPKDNIDRAIKKGTGDLDGIEYNEMVYEAYGPGGVALLIEILTDNRNRTASDIRNILTKSGGSLGETGCVAYQFKRKGVIAYDSKEYQEDEILEIAIESGAEDVSIDDGTIEVITEPEEFETVLDALESGGYKHTMAEVMMVSDMMINLDKKNTQKALNVIEALEDNDDVQNVSTNLRIADDFELDE